MCKNTHTLSALWLLFITAALCTRSCSNKHKLQYLILCAWLVPECVYYWRVGSAPRRPTDTATPAAGPNQACAQLPTASSGLASANQGVAIFALARCTKKHATAPKRYKQGGGGNSSAVL
jgi:hypothetical protein